MSSTTPNDGHHSADGQRRVVVVYESMFGNTATVATTIAAELAAAGVAVEWAAAAADTFPARDERIQPGTRGRGSEIRIGWSA